MSILPLARRDLVEGRRGLLGWALGLAAVTSLYLPLYPSIGGNPEFAAVIEGLPSELVRTLNYDDILSGAGYTQGTVYGLLGFLLLVIAATAWGSAAIAGDEERGGLELVLAHGVGRERVLLERGLVVLLKLVLLVALVTALVAIYSSAFDLGVGIDGLIGGGLALLLLSTLSGAAALGAGEATGRRMLAIAGGAGIAVVGYALNALGNQSADLEWVGDLSPYSWAFGEEPLRNGVDAGGLGLLLALSVLAVVIGMLVLRRRDIGR